MTSEYKNFDPKCCKAAVYRSSGRWLRSHQCERKIWRDGWCKQHHPDTVAERERERMQRYEEQCRRSPRVQLDRAHEEIVRLKVEIARLRARIAELEACLIPIPPSLTDSV